MLIKKIREIPNIQTIITADEVYFRNLGNNIINYDLELVYANNSGEFHFYNWKNEIYIGEITNNYVYKLKKDQLELLSVQGNFIRFLAKKKFLLARNENDDRFLSYRDNDLVVWEKKMNTLNHSLVLNEKYYAYKPSYKATNIEVRNISDYSLRFEYEFDPTYRAGRTLFMSQNILVVPFLRTNPNYKARIIGLDLRTGNKLWSFEVNTHEFILSEESRKLFGLIGSASSNILSLEIVDIANGSIEKPIIGESISTDVVSWNAIVKNGHLFYSDNIDECKIGVLDLNSKTIISELELGLKNGVKISEPKIWDNKLFVMDTSKVCHELEICFS